MSCWWLLLFAWVFFLPITYAIPLYWLEKSYFHNSHETQTAQAIVILGAGLTNSSSMQQPNVNAQLLERIRFGAYLQRKTNLPILVTGDGFHTTFTEAEMMKKVSEEEFHAHVDFVEEESDNTVENAKFSYEILKKNNIESIFLVSSSWHLKRAELMFQQYAPDIKTIPIADFFYASKEFTFDREDYFFSLATPYYQKRYYSEVIRLLWLRIISTK